MARTGGGLFQGASELTRCEVFRWWEARRLRFNLYVGTVGVVTWLLVMIAGSAAVKPGGDFEEPIVMMIGPFIYAVLFNLCYSVGPLINMTFFRARPQVKLFKTGLTFSAVLTALPGAWALFAWVISISTGKKLGGW